DGWYGDGNTALPRRFWIVFTLEDVGGTPPALASILTDVFRAANRYKAGEERVADVTGLSFGRVFDFHPLTGLPHTFDDPGPGIDTFDSSAGLRYREL